MIEKVAQAIWRHRRAHAASFGIDLEEWDDGGIPRANGVFEEARAAIEAMASWRDISTAPKDQRILGWDGREINTLDWGNGYWQQVSDSGRATAFDPTHWQPLLSPPPKSP